MGQSSSVDSQALSTIEVRFGTRTQRLGLTNNAIRQVLVTETMQPAILTIQVQALGRTRFTPTYGARLVFEVMKALIPVGTALFSEFISHVQTVEIVKQYSVKVYSGKEVQGRAGQSLMRIVYVHDSESLKVIMGQIAQRVVSQRITIPKESGEVQVEANWSSNDVQVFTGLEALRIETQGKGQPSTSRLSSIANVGSSLISKAGGIANVASKAQSVLASISPSTLDSDSDSGVNDFASILKTLKPLTAGLTTLYKSGALDSLLKNTNQE